VTTEKLNIVIIKREINVSKINNEKFRSLLFIGKLTVRIKNLSTFEKTNLRNIVTTIVHKTIVLEYVFNKNNTISSECNVSEKKAKTEKDVNKNMMIKPIKSNIFIMGLLSTPKFKILRTKKVLYKRTKVII